MSKTFKPYVEKLGGSDPASYLGNPGEVFYDPSIPILRLADGATPGGIYFFGGAMCSAKTVTTATYSILSTVFASAPTWNSVPGYAWTEYATNVNMLNGWDASNNFHVLVDSFASGVGSGLGTTPTLTVSDNVNNTIYQNYDSTDSQILAIVSFRLGTTNSNLRASLAWAEQK
jgi:hypothetical protein